MRIRNLRLASGSRDVNVRAFAPDAFVVWVQIVRTVAVILFVANQTALPRAQVRRCLKNPARIFKACILKVKPGVTDGEDKNCRT